MATGLTFSVFGRDVSASSTLRRVGGEAEQASNTIGSHFKKLGGIIAGAFAGGAAVSFFKDSFAEAAEAQKVGAQTAAVLKSTGGAANVTAGQIGNLATSISNKVGIDDEAIQSGENLLLTFTGIRNEVGKGNDIFNQATQTVTDMSVALGQDMKSSAIQVGKALNDPIKGLTALSRVGVSFTAQQKKQITALVDSGQKMKAQKIILGELKKEFGGSAAAQATDADKMKVAFGNLEEAVGTALMPAISKLANFITTHVIPAFQKMLSWIQNHQSTVKALAIAVGALFTAFLAYKIIDTVRTSILALNLAMEANPIGLVVAALAALAVGLAYAWNHSETFRNIVKKTWHDIAAVAMWLWHNILQPIFEALKAAFKVVVTVIRTYVGIWIGLFHAVATAAMWLWHNIIQPVASGIGSAFHAIGQALSWVWNNVIHPIISAISSAWHALGSAIHAVGAAIGAAFHAVGSALSAAWGVIHAIISAISSAWHALYGAVSSVGHAIGTAFGAMASALKSAYGPISSVIGGIRSLLSEVSSAISAVNSALDSLIGKEGHLTNPGGSFPSPNAGDPGRGALYHAQGAGNFAGGLSWVGERGPELVGLPRGARITSHSQAMSMARMGQGGGYVHVTVNVNGSVLSERDLVGAVERGVRQAGVINIGSRIR